ncbi:MAG TPA: DUF5668 domain-containing protein [Acidobacteriota bacterium]|nr:DUF5668 domain-containing protein [Acidobacteriota bacterium]
MNDGMQQQQGSWQHRPESGRREHSPARAALCALVMGLGAVYNREYTKAVVHFAIFAGLVTLADSVGEFFGFAAFVFYLFTIMDAYRSAEVIERRLQEDPDYRSPQETINFPLWGGILVAMGVLFLLENLGIFSVASILRVGWPLILIGLGLYLIFMRDKDRHDRILSTTPPPAPMRESGPQATEEQRYE